MVQWLRMQVLGMEVLGSNSGHDSADIFYAPFFLPVTALLELHLLGFCFITL